MILHTVNQSFYSSRCLNDCLALCTSTASILLIEDGVYAATFHTSELFEKYSNITVYALKADLIARGLMSSLNSNIRIIDDHGFVDLCVTHDTILSWY